MNVAKPDKASGTVAPSLSQNGPADRTGNRLGEIVYRNPADLVPYDRNSRKHSPRQVQQVRASIDEFGFTNPVLLRERRSGKGMAARIDYTIGAGHGRTLAALLDPPLAKIPTIIVHGLNDKQWRALIIADNKLALNAEWDTDMLAAELHDLQVGGFDLPVIGFTDGELADLSEIPAPSESSGDGNPATVTCPKCQHNFVPEQG